MKLSPACFLLLSVACASSPPPAPASASASTPAPASATSEREVMLAGCAASVRAPNEAQLTKRAIDAGDEPEYAAVKAKFLLGKTNPVFTQACECFFAQVGEERLKREGAAAMATVPKEAAEACVTAMVQALPKYLRTPEEVAEFEKLHASKK